MALSMTHQIDNNFIMHNDMSWRSSLRPGQGMDTWGQGMLVADARMTLLPMLSNHAKTQNRYLLFNATVCGHTHCVCAQSVVGIRTHSPGAHEHVHAVCMPSCAASAQFFLACGGGQRHVVILVRNKGRTPLDQDKHALLPV